MHIRRMTVMMRSASAPNVNPQTNCSKDTADSGFKNPGFKKETVTVEVPDTKSSESIGAHIAET